MASSGRSWTVNSRFRKARCRRVCIVGAGVRWWMEQEPISAYSTIPSLEKAVTDFERI
ncbi:MAG TPA: hypothetical protein VHS27_10390 [Gaiellales bacterium]|jgi:hypothetical protein|nr:hypothetical protein [Gaiellales bacterium]